MQRYNGKACAGKAPGPGGKGSGASFQRNYAYLKQHVKLQMDVLSEPFVANTSTQLFGKTLSLPVLAAPIGMLAFNISDALDDYTYDCAVLDDGLATAEVLPAIRKAVGDRLKIFVDGGIRTELIDTMNMCNCPSLAAINRSKIAIVP